MQQLLKMFEKSTDTKFSVIGDVSINVFFLRLFTVKWNERVFVHMCLFFICASYVSQKLYQNSYETTHIFLECAK